MSLLANARGWLSQPILPGGIFEPMMRAIEGCVELTGSMCAGVVGLAQGAGEAASSVLSFGGGGADRSHDTAQRVTVPAQQQTVEVVAASSNKYEVPIAELGCLSAPSFGSCSRGGAGIGM